MKINRIIIWHKHDKSIQIWLLTWALLSSHRTCNPGADTRIWCIVQGKTRLHLVSPSYSGSVDGHETLTWCWFNVRPPSQTLAQHWNIIRWTFRFCWIGSGTMAFPCRGYPQSQEQSIAYPRPLPIRRPATSGFCFWCSFVLQANIHFKTTLRIVIIIIRTRVDVILIFLF